MGPYSRSLKDKEEGVVAKSRGSRIHAVGCAKALGLERLGMLGEQKEGHMLAC